MPKIVADKKIYDAVLQTIAERGYSGATTKQIAEAAEISEVTLFRKYGNKAEVVKQAIIAMMEELDLGSAAIYTGDVFADLLRVVEVYQGSAQKSGQFIFTILLELPRYPELVDVIDMPLSFINSIGQLLGRYQEEGVLKQEHPLHALAGLLGPIIAIHVFQGVSTNLAELELDLLGHVRRFLNGRSTCTFNA